MKLHRFYLLFSIVLFNSSSDFQCFATESKDFCSNAIEIACGKKLLSIHQSLLQSKPLTVENQVDIDEEMERLAKLSVKKELREKISDNVKKIVYSKISSDFGIKITNTKMDPLDYLAETIFHIKFSLDELNRKKTKILFYEHKETEEEFSKRMDELEKRLSPLKPYLFTTLTSGYKAIQAEIFNETKSLIPSFNATDLYPFFNQLKEQLVIQYIQKTAFSYAKDYKLFSKQSYIQNLSTVKLFTPETIALEKSKDNPLFFDPIQGVYSTVPLPSKVELTPTTEDILMFTSGCANHTDNQFYYNAFYVPTTNAIYICPGLYAKALLLGSKEKAMALFSFVLGHELGHSIDPDPTLRKYLSPSVQSDYKNKLIDFQINPLESIETASENYMGEIIGDHFGTLGFAKSLKNLKTLNQKDKQFIIIDFAREICSSLVNSDEIHPNLTYRLENILFNNDDVRTELGCAPKNIP